MSNSFKLLYSASLILYTVKTLTYNVTACLQILHGNVQQTFKSSSTNKMKLLMSNLKECESVSLLTLPCTTAETEPATQWTANWNKNPPSTQKQEWGELAIRLLYWSKDKLPWWDLSGTETRTLDMKTFLQKTLRKKG